MLKFVIPVACTYGEPLCDEVGAQFYLLIVFVSASSATPSWFWSIDDKVG